LSWDIYFPRVQELFDDNGQLRPENITRYTQNLQKIYDELIWMARIFKKARQGLAET
jgi:hypothetical protein